MKKRILSLLLTFVILLGILPYPTNAKEGIKIIVDGKEIKTDVEPYIENNRTMVPVRFITEALGGEVSFNKAEEMYPIESIVITAPDDALWLAVFPGHRGALISEGAYKSDVPPVIKSGRTMIPLRFIADYLGCTTSWDESTNTIIINSGDINKRTFEDQYWDEKMATELGNMLMTGDISSDRFSKAVY